MFRRFATLTVLAAWAVATAEAPEPKAAAPDYFPTRVGDKRVYSTTVRGETFEVTEVVTAVERKDGAVLVSLGRGWDGGAVEPLSFKFRVTNTGMCRHRVDEDGRLRADPLWLLRLPAKAGDAWTGDREDLPASKLTGRTAGEEDIAVPGGKFRAVRVEVTVDWPKPFGQGQSRTTTWYAPNVGRVKEVHRVDDVEAVTVLKSFTPGKD